MHIHDPFKKVVIHRCSILLIALNFKRLKNLAEIIPILLTKLICDSGIAYTTGPAAGIEHLLL